MAVLATDLIVYNSLNRPEDDTTLTGGGIDVDHRPVFTPLAANDTLEMLSSAAGDTTQTVTITGRDAVGAIISDVQTLNGTTVVSFTGTFERVLKVVMSADAVGIITIRRASAGPTVGTIPVGERGFNRMFYDSASEAASVERYEKVFGRNNNGTDTLTNAEIELTADPSSRIRIGLAATKGDTATIANRKAVPAGITFVDDNVAQAVPTDQLAAGEAIGVWIEQDLLADDSPFKSSFDLTIRGTTV